MRRLALATLLALAAPPVAACSSSRYPSGVEVLTLEVAPHKVDCTGEARQRCLRVRRAADQPWTNFYDTIEGFTHEDGYHYRLEVDRRRVASPPADGSAFRYRLLRVLSKEPEAPGGG